MAYYSPSNKSDRLNVPGSTFNYVGHDQTNNLNLQCNHTNNAYFFVSASGLEVLSPKRVTTTGTSYHSSDARTFCDIFVTANLIVKIVQSLIDRTNKHRHIMLVLQSLYRTLILMSSALQHYESTPLAQSLANIVNSEVKQCDVVLHKLLDRIDDYRRTLIPTSISGLWRHVWWSGWDINELELLGTELSVHLNSLDVILKVLNSVNAGWLELGNKMRATHAALRQGSPSLGHIHENTVLVQDHLGISIPVPILFCSTWEGFDYIIKGYCKDRIGHRYIQRGDYQVLHADDTQVIGPSEFPSTVKAGMILEMSIVLRQRTDLGGGKEKCPRCHYINSTTTQISGWIECRKCSGKYQVAKADGSENHYKGKGDSDGEDSDGEDEAIRNEKSDEDCDEEIISPASRTRVKKSGTQFFRRIHIIYTDNEVLRLPTRWSDKDRHPLLRLSHDGRELRLRRSHHDSRLAGAVRTDYPIDPACGVYYYEVEIVSRGLKGHIGIGFSTCDVNLSRLPGWSRNSWGYHGDDGYSFASELDGTPYGPTFGTGDIIGCGIDFDQHCVFYTKNRIFLGSAFDNVGENCDIFPTVGVRHADEVLRVNFTPDPFNFDIVMQQYRNQNTPLAAGAKSGERKKGRNTRS